MSELNITDYTKILEYYKKDIPKSHMRVKLDAEKILSEKLCRCIKKLGPENEERAIGICTKTIFKRKGLTRGKFNCKGKRNITIRKIHKVK
jgi:hypothetical protein